MLFLQEASILLLLIVVNVSSASDFKLCCSFGYQYVPETKSCSAMENRSLLTNLTFMPIFNVNTEVRKIDISGYNIVQDPWCRNTEGQREIYKIDDEYFVQDNGNIFIPEEQEEHFNKNEYCLGLLKGTTSYTPFMCAVGEGIAPTYHNSIGMIISMPFLMVTFFVYACVPELQNIHGKCLMCYVSTLLIAYVFLVSVQLNNKTEDAFCIVAPFIIYFAFMVSFMWLNVMCIDIWWTFSGRKGFRDSGSNSERTRFTVYSIYAWGIPLLMLFVAIALQFAQNLPSYVVSPKFGTEKCWFPDDLSMGYYFYGPILIIILANLTLFAYTSIQIYKVQRDVDQSMRHESQRHGSDKEMKQRYKLYLKLMLVFGVNWLMEIVSWLVSGPQWLWYVTDMCNALYGVFIFFIFVCKANVWKLCRKRYHVFMGRPYLANTYAPTSSTRSTGVSQSTTAHAPGNGTEADSYGLTSSTAA